MIYHFQLYMKDCSYILRKCFNSESKISTTNVSKAIEKSINTTLIVLYSRYMSIFIKSSSEKWVIAVDVQWFFVKPNWNSYKIPYSPKNARINSILSHDTPTIHCFNRSVKSFSPLISIQKCDNDLSHCSPLKSLWQTLIAY